MRITWGQIKEDVGRPIGVCSTDSMLLKMVNEASEILHNESDYVGKYIKYRIRVSGDCNNNKSIVWPRQLETIEKLALCSQPVGIRDQWFEFEDNGTGLAIDWHGGNLLSDAGEVCTLEEISGVTSKIKIYADKVEAGGSRILLLGYDENFNWIRTQVGSEWIDGEYVTITNSTPTVSINYFSKITGVQKDLTNGPVRMYALDTLTLVETPIGIYEYDETLPVYRRSTLTGITCSNCECVYVMGKRRFIKAKVDTDYVYPSYTPSLQMGLIAIHKRDQGDLAMYGSFMVEAKRLLSKQAQGYKGNGPFKSIVHIDRATWASGCNIQ